MLANNGDVEGLFHAAVMMSGAPVPVGDLTIGQEFYDDLVERTGCRKAENTFTCLQRVARHTVFEMKCVLMNFVTSRIHDCKLRCN